MLLVELVVLVAVALRVLSPPRPANASFELRAAAVEAVLAVKAQGPESKYETQDWVRRRKCPDKGGSVVGFCWGGKDIPLPIGDVSDWLVPCIK